MHSKRAQTRPPSRVRMTMLDLSTILGAAILIAALLTHAGLAYLRVATCTESGLATLTCIL